MRLRWHEAWSFHNESCTIQKNKSQTSSANTFRVPSSSMTDLGNELLLFLNTECIEILNAANIVQIT